ncbi:C-type lectin domain family 7 member A-like isoform X2 [Syngnathoides biaculeatus]|uniref:C-type lectin domain family 7 member A-like isoform X2 n=1 Tax=Syngnathoides biaculeatus TaxID=300417 RepID=UPI002ADD35EF|nr:C-type lectin domain family 7 member A-like isoform X2 [Syngnathoides biaculeatus]
MQEGAAKKNSREDKGAKEPMLEMKGDGNIYTLAGSLPSEEGEQSDYMGLQSPSEDIYLSVLEPPKQTAKQAQDAVRLYRVACLILSVLCLVLLLVVIVLTMKMKTGSETYPVTSVSWAPPKCNMEQCRAFILQDRDPLTTGSEAYPVTPVSWAPPTCNMEQCRAFIQRDQCPPGWLRLDQSCFVFSTSRLSWEESQTNCSGLGGSLAVVSSPKVQTFLTKNGNSLLYWIGLSKGRGDQWTWVDNTTQVLSYWGPHLIRGNCALLNNRLHPESNWVMAACSSYSYYICQMNLCFAPHQEASSRAST